MAQTAKVVPPIFRSKSYRWLSVGDAAPRKGVLDVGAQDAEGYSKICAPVLVFDGVKFFLAH